MRSIEWMIKEILRREGGYVDHPADRGGPTNFGITQKTLSLYIGRAALVSDVKALKPDIAAEIYEQIFITSREFINFLRLSKVLYSTARSITDHDGQ